MYLVQFNYYLVCYQNLVTEVESDVFPLEAEDTYRYSNQLEIENHQNACWDANKITGKQLGGWAIKKLTINHVILAHNKRSSSLSYKVVS